VLGIGEKKGTGFCYTFIQLLLGCSSTTLAALNKKSKPPPPWKHGMTGKS